MNFSVEETGIVVIKLVQSSKGKTYRLIADFPAFEKELKTFYFSPKDIHEIRRMTEL